MSVNWRKRKGSWNKHRWVCSIRVAGMTNKIKGWEIGPVQNMKNKDYTSLLNNNNIKLCTKSGKMNNVLLKEIYFNRKYFCFAIKNLVIVSMSIILHTSCVQ